MNPTVAVAEAVDAPTKEDVLNRLPRHPLFLSVFSDVFRLGIVEKNHYLNTKAKQVKIHNSRSMIICNGQSENDHRSPHIYSFELVIEMLLEDGFLEETKDEDGVFLKIHPEVGSTFSTDNGF